MRLTITGEYPADWKEIAARVKTKAGNRCIRCGHPDGDRMREGKKSLESCGPQCTHPKNGKLRQLTVHHLDGNKSNCRWWNLLALCQLCHLTIQGKVIPERPFLWEHSEWFKPYAAGFYAFWFARMEIPREEIEGAVDAYLAVGQPWLYEDASAFQLEVSHD